MSVSCVYVCDNPAQHMFSLVTENVHSRWNDNYHFWRLRSGSWAYPGNTEREIGIHPGLDTIPSFIGLYIKLVITVQ